MVIFTARQNLANLNEVKMNLIVKFANLAGKSYIIFFTPDQHGGGGGMTPCAPLATPVCNHLYYRITGSS